MTRSAKTRSSEKRRSRTLVIAVLLFAVACGGSGTSTLGADGGAGSGGSAAGSGGTGGSSAGTGGTSGASGSGGTSAACEVDADCRLHSDCCTCEAVHVDSNPGICKADCDQKECNLQGIIAARCEDGQCVPLSNCRDLPSPTMCDPTPPACAPGQRPVNGNFGGQCFTGECADAADCVNVPDCAECGADDYCVEDVFVAGVAGGSNEVRYRCRPKPAGCGAMVDCTCSNACSAEAECADLPEGVRCTEYGA